MDTRRSESKAKGSFIHGNRLASFGGTYVDKTIPNLSKKDVIVLTPKHVPDLQELITPEATLVFGSVDVYEVLYNAFLSLGVLSPEGELVGAACFLNYPNINAVPPWCWLQWMRNLFGCESVTQRNSIWIQLLLWKPKFASVFLKPILQYFFSKQKYKAYVLVAIPPGVKSINFLGDNASRILPRGYVNPSTSTTLGLMARQYYMVNYKIRKAVEEDNDDLIPLIARFSPRLHELYGNYYIAELLTRFPNSTRSIIVAEYEGYAVAVIIMNEVVNYEILNENFELVCFHGLRKPHERDSLGYPQLDEIELKDTLDQKIATLPRINQTKPWRLPTPDEDENRDIDENWVLSDSAYNMLPIILDEESDFHGDPRFEMASVPTVPEEPDEEVCSALSSALIFDEYESHLFTESLRESKSVSSTNKLDTHIFRQLERPVSQPIPNFYGQKNAFVLEVVAAKEGHDEALELLIEASFESFPERNYCCICIPTTHPPVGFLERFVRVPPRGDGKFPHELFVLHRNAVQPEIHIRMAIQEDKPYISDFLLQMHNVSTVIEQVKFALSTDPKNDNSSNLCFLMIAYQQIVGLAILSESIELDYIMSHYTMYRWVDERSQEKGSYAVIENLLIYPVFQNFSTFFLTQMHALADYSVIFYVITPEDMSAERQRPICNIIQQFIPITPRMVQDYSPKYLKGDLMPAEHITKLDTPFSLFLSMTRLSSISRIEINARIVVVGSGDTASSFLETLICTSSPDLLVTFTSVVVVSPHGLAHQKEPNRARDTFFIHRGHFSHRYMHLTSLRAHLNFTPSIISEIKRQDKQVIMSDGTFLPYDILVLLVGEQYQAPTLKKGGYSDIPANVFIINTDTDATYALKKLAEIMINDINPEGKVIVYGHDLRSHCALAALIEYGIPRELIVFVNPISRTFDVENLISYDNLIYDDPDIEIAIVRILQKEGIALYQGFFNDWDLNVQTNYVKLVKFECAQRMLTLQCKCIFLFTQKYISRKTFQAIVNSGLVFDEEVGEKIGLHIRNMLIPEAYKPRRQEKPDKYPIKSIKQKDALPTFTKPIVKVCTVVGRLNYCHITKPGKQIPAELEVTRADFGQLYVTGDLDNLNRQGYFRIHINEFKVVETITCLTKDEIYVNSLLQIWGKHVKMLNNLQLRFELMMVPDLLEFFKEPWTCAIYYDRFKEVREKIYETIVETEVENGKSLADMTHAHLIKNNWKHLKKEQKLQILRLFNESNLRDKIEDEIVEYIAANTIELPMYAHPNLIRNILHDYEKSPMFSE
ncbi:cilia- and flagella-associated protein 61-like isoform X2 [Harmonia axyridis]|uniref:cilia- and flagella-associated protein 61-like isoform X2 n=1 Tax=Harmonia axyridis TaxID=115357 RepID=UPI001E2755BB|nr:cilia- and flagella-associated protein 61-like isoform X2 [Harmonia axyridis]